MTAESGLPAVSERLPKPDPDRLRISDHDRQEFIAQLTRHCAEGRLTFEELDERIEHAWSARTRAELRPLGEDLPVLASASEAAPTLQSWLDDGKTLLMTVPTRILIAGGTGLVLLFMLFVMFAGHIPHDGHG